MSNIKIDLSDIPTSKADLARHRPVPASEQCQQSGCPREGIARGNGILLCDFDHERMGLTLSNRNS